jgi:2-aminoadipate transaminase
MNHLFAERIKDVPKSFIREILKVAANPEIISFAGGLPNADFFPQEEINKACSAIIKESGRDVFQYSTTEGYLPLRKYIADRYMEKHGLKIDADEILITNGSQQGLDLLGKIFVNEGENVIIENPGYLGAIQALSVYRPYFIDIAMNEEGIDVAELEKVVNSTPVKLFYSVPNFQNPSGITYSEERRKKVAEILKDKNIVFVEDNPYGELRFMGEDIPPIKKYLPNGIMLGSFSKIVVPSFRIGWIVAPKEIMEKLVVAKQASDLHTNYFSQRVIFEYLSKNSIDDHIAKIKDAYGKQREAMVKAIEKYFPKEVKITKPEGGMFLWAELPAGVSSLTLFELAIKRNVAFVPGSPFYANGGGENTMRLNYSCTNEEKIDEGIKRLADAVKELMAGSKEEEYILM